MSSILFLIRDLSHCLHAHAQWEIRQYALAMSKLVQLVAPIAWDAFEEFKLNAVTFSKVEAAIVREGLITNCSVTQLSSFRDLNSKRKAKLLEKLKQRI